ncbi:MAG: hypothetical protein H6607_04980 [Flavobacteriales bacterium]|nr:hypothetical protein [Flavobacteriales bacterium]
MKALKKISLWLIVLLVLLTGAAVALPIIYKKDIVNYIKQDLNKTLNAQVAFDEDISINIFRSFPDLTLGINDFLIVGKAEFDKDTLVYSDNIKTTVDLKTLYYDSKLKIKHLSLNNPLVNLISTPQKSNWDIVVPSTDTSTSETNITADFDKILIIAGELRYTDTATNTKLKINGIDGNFAGNFASDTFDLSSDFDCKRAYVSYDNIPYVNNIPLKVDAVTSINITAENYLFKQNNIWVGDMLLTGDGSIGFVGDDIEIDLKYQSSKADFQQLLSLVPEYYRSDLNDFKTSGNAIVSGTVRGVVSDTSLPGYTFNMALNNGELGHKNLTTPIQNVNFVLDVQNPDGQDNSLIVDLQKLSFIHNKEPFEANLLLKTPMTDPYIKGNAKGKINLKDIENMMPKDPNRVMSGILSSDVSFAGNYSSIEKEDYTKFNSSGKIEAINVVYKDEDLPQKVNISKGQINFTNKGVNLPFLDVTTAKSDVSLHGIFDNFFGYILKNETLSGNLNVSSNNLIADEFTEETPTAANDTATDLTIEIPGNINMDLVYDIKNLNYGKYNFKNLVGSSRVEQNTLKINQLTTGFLGGFVSFKGFYNTTNPNKPLADLQLTVQNLGITEVFSQFETIRLLAPIGKYVKGKFNGTFSLNTSLLKDFSPDLKNINATGAFNLFNCDVEGLKSVNELANKLNYEPMKKPFKIKDLLLSFKIKDGKIEVNPFDFPIGETQFNLGGYSKLDYSLFFDGLLTVPKALYMSNVSTYRKFIPQNQWVNLDSTDFKNLQFAVKIIGNFTNPKVELNFQNIKKNLKDEIKSRVSDEVNKRTEELKRQTQEQIDRAKQQADAAKREAEARAKAAAEEQKRKIEEQAKKEQEAAKKRIEEELKKKREELLKKPPFGK